MVFKQEGDVMMYVVGGPEENEVLLGSVVAGLRDGLGVLLKYAYHSPGTPEVLFIFTTRKI